jgi:RNA polymerases M/15 Kd subunit
MPTTRWFGRAKVRAEFRKPRAEFNLVLQRAAACSLYARVGILSTALIAVARAACAPRNGPTAFHFSAPGTRLHLILCSSMAASMRFCKECNNLLHPREAKAEQKLYFACNRCAYQELADASCVYQNYLVKATE